MREDPGAVQQAKNESAATKLSNTTAEAVLSICSGTIRSQIITPVWYSIQYHDFECDIAFIQMFHKCMILVNSNKREEMMIYKEI